MANVSLSVNYRPLRIGFCVRENNIPDILNAVELNTILWGGIYNPIIPIGTNTDLAENLIKCFNVDLLYPVTSSSEINQFIERHRNLKWHIDFRDSSVLVQDTIRGKTGLKPSVLDVSNIIDHYWEKEFKIRKKSNCIIPEWKADDPLFNLFSIEFGKIPNQPNLFYNYTEAFKNGLRAKIIPIAKTTQLKKEFKTKIPPITITGDRLKMYGGGFGWNTDGIYVGYPNNSMDLINFWNLRASYIDIRFLPIKGKTRVKDVIKDHIQEVHKYDETKQFPLGVGVWYQDNLDEETVKKAYKDIIPENYQKSHQRLHVVSWNGLNIKSAKATFDSKTIIASLDFPYKKPQISIQLPEKPIENKNQYNSDQLLAFSLKPLGEHDYEGYTLELPNIPELNEWYAREITFHGNNLRVDKNECSVILPIHDSTINLYPLEGSSIIKKLFSHAGIESKQSKPGLIAKRLMEQMGGLDECRVFKITGVRKLISSLDPANTTTYSTAIQNIRDVDLTTGIPSFDKHKTLAIQQRNTPELTPQEVWDYLLEKNAFRVGLHPECPNCKLPFWLPIKDASDIVECEYCGFKFKIAPQLRTRGDFHFRKSGLFGRDDNQEGAIPVILTLLRFFTLDPFEAFLYTTALELKSTTLDINCETDLVILGKTNEGKPTIVIGECKTGDEISDQDIANLLNVKKALEKIGVETFIVFSKTSQFTPDEITRFKGLLPQRIYPILFTPDELEPYELYDHYRQHGITDHQLYDHTLMGLAINSQTIYLQ